MYFQQAIINEVNEVWPRIQREWSKFDSQVQLSKRSPEDMLIKRMAR